MAGTFSYTDTLSATRDLVRYLIGDTVTTYRMFYNEEVDALIARFDDDPYIAAGWALRILAHDPDRLILTKDSTAGGFVLLGLMQLMAARGDRWLA